MKHFFRLPNFKILLIAGGLFSVTLASIIGCKPTSKTSSSNSAKMSSPITDTSGMMSDTTGGGKQVGTGKDKPPRK